MNSSSHIYLDTLFAADLTIMEEGTELLHRLAEHLEGHPNKDEPMPMFTSCCPGWVGENSRLKHAISFSVDLPNENITVPV